MIPRVTVIHHRDGKHDPEPDTDEVRYIHGASFDWDDVNCGECRAEQARRMSAATRCAHGGLVDVDGSVSCQDCDWCSREQRVTEWDGEVCTSCGRTWGDDDLSESGTVPDSITKHHEGTAR